MNEMNGKVYFVGAGPGDPELITVKGRNLLEKADVIVYAGSLVNPVLLEFRKRDAELHDSSKMTLEQISKVLLESYRAGRQVVRLASGDPSIFGAVEEMSDLLNDSRIPIEIVPGVSSFTAAAASLKRSLTVPDMAQTVILTRAEGRTKMPPLEQLEELARHQASLVLFLSAALAQPVQKKLLNFYPSNTPVAIIYRVSWPEEKIVCGELKELAEIVQREKIRMTALIFVGQFLAAHGRKSKLYDKSFSHSFRKASVE